MLVAALLRGDADRARALLLRLAPVPAIEDTMVPSVELQCIGRCSVSLFALVLMLAPADAVHALLLREPRLANARLRGRVLLDTTTTTKQKVLDTTPLGFALDILERPGRFMMMLTGRDIVTVLTDASELARLLVTAPQLSADVHTLLEDAVWAPGATVGSCLYRATAAQYASLQVIEAIAAREDDRLPPLIPDARERAGLVRACFDKHATEVVAFLQALCAGADHHQRRLIETPAEGVNAARRWRAWCAQQHPNNDTLRMVEAFDALRRLGLRLSAPGVREAAGPPHPAIEAADGERALRTLAVRRALQMQHLPPELQRAIAAYANAGVRAWSERVGPLEHPAAQPHDPSQMMML